MPRLPESAALVSVPVQARGWETLEHIVEAATELLEKRPFDAVRVEEVAARAGCSVGSFYVRFADKEALLDYLDELYARDLIELIGGLASRAGDADGLEAFVRELWARLVAFHGERRGLIRALVLAARSGVRPRFDERTRRMNRTLPPLCDAVLRFAAEIRHPRPDRAVPLGLAFAYTAMREHILFPETLEVPRASDAELVDELTRLLMRYLDAGPGPA